MDNLEKEMLDNLIIELGVEGRFGGIGELYTSIESLKGDLDDFKQRGPKWIKHLPNTIRCNWDRIPMYVKFTAMVLCMDLADRTVVADDLERSFEKLSGNLMSDEG